MLLFLEFELLKVMFCDMIDLMIFLSFSGLTNTKLLALLHELAGADARLTAQGLQLLSTWHRIWQTRGTQMHSAKRTAALELHGGRRSRTVRAGFECVQRPTRRRQARSWTRAGGRRPMRSCCYRDVEAESPRRWGAAERGLHEWPPPPWWAGDTSGAGLR